MKLQIGPNLENGRVRLDYKSSPNKPSRVPSYTIAENKADEFVSKYNFQVDDLHKLTTACTVGGGLGGWLVAIKKAASGSKSQFFATVLGLPIGILAGTLVSAIISYEKKNNLMDKYGVEIYQK